MEDIETVREHCKNTDCVYRSKLLGCGTPFCQYCLIEEHSRGCKISECDKYKPGEAKQPRLSGEMVIWWEYEYYDEDADFVW